MLGPDISLIIMEDIIVEVSSWKKKYNCEPTDLGNYTIYKSKKKKKKKTAKTTNKMYNKVIKIDDNSLKYFFLDSQFLHIYEDYNF